MIPSYGQTGSNDTLTCYDNAELKKIATRVVRSRECDSLLIATEEILQNQATSIENFQSIIVLKDSLIEVKESSLSTSAELVEVKDAIIQEEERLNEELRRKLKFTRAGWGASSILLTILLVLSVL